MKNEEPMNWKNIVSPLYERAKSPLYGSFMVSWLLWNWKIVFVVIFISKYSLEGLNLDKYILKYYWGPWDGVVIPLVLACIYLFLLPSVDNGIAIFRAKAKKRREVKEIAINRNSREVSGEEHYQLNLKYIAERNRVLDFEKQLDAESLKTREAEHSLSQLEKSYQELAGNAEDRNTELETIKTEHRRLLNRHAIPNTFQGRWTYTHTSPENPRAPEKMEIKINGDTIYIVSDDGSMVSRYKLKLIDWDETAKTLSFVKHDITTGLNTIQVLGYVSARRFDGMEDGKLNVGYIKEE